MNNGTLISAPTLGFTTGIEVDNGDVIIINNGTIQARNNAVDTDSSSFLTFTNNGSIQVGDSGLLVRGGGRIFNYGRIQATRIFGRGVNFSGQPIYLENKESGEILGQFIGIDTTGLQLTVVNEGTIQGTSDQGIRSNAEDSTTIINLRTGIIRGRKDAILMASKGTLYNSGLIEASFDDSDNGIIRFKETDIDNIALADASNTFINESGIVRGDGGVDVAFEGGNDRMEIRNRSIISGTIDGGGATDTLVIHARGLQQTDINSINALVNGNGTFTVHGQTFTTANFENLIFSFEQYVDILPESLKDFGKELDSLSGDIDEDLRQVLAGIDLLETGDPLNQAVHSISGQDFINSFSEISFDTNSQLLSDLLHQIRNAHFNQGANTQTAFNLDENTLNPLLENTVEQLLASSGTTSHSVSDVATLNSTTVHSATEKDTGVRLETDDPLSTPNAHFFFMGSGRSVRQDGTDSRSEGEYRLTGMTVGGGFDLTDHLTAGAYAGYHGTSARVDENDSQLHGDSARTGVYLSHFKNDWLLTGITGYTYTDHSMHRSIQVPHFNGAATGSTTSHQFHLAFSASRDFYLDEKRTLRLTPSASMTYSQLKVNGYKESGAQALNLKFENQTAHSFRTKLGLTFSKHYDTEWGWIAPYTSAHWTHEFLNDSRGVTVDMADPGMDTFTVSSDAPERDYVTLGAGTQGSFFESKSIRFSLGYQLQAGQDGYQAHSGTAGMHFGF